MEKNGSFSAGIALGKPVIGFAGYYNFGLRGRIHDTTAQAQWSQTVAVTEELRAMYVINGLRKACEQGCKCANK